MIRAYWLAIGLFLFVALSVQALFQLGPDWAPQAVNRHKVNPDNADRVKFSRDIEPILSQFCYDCHGPDRLGRKAALRLDTSEGLLGKTRSGVHAVLPHNVSSSELLRRITTTDADEKMPPPRIGRKLSAAQIELLCRWVEEGAAIESHWSFQPISRSAVPGTDTTIHPIDRFIQARLATKGLRLAPRAPRDVLIKRLKMDLLGLPPTLAEMSAFCSDPDPQAYEKLIERYLNSPHYGEKMALHWLDAARYADSQGTGHDDDRTIWTFRDWIIAAFNRHMKFDTFSVMQLAGDHLADTQPRDLVATAFHRCGIGPECGNNPEDFEEYRAKVLSEMVNTTAKVWLGLTLECAQCHDHKYDPITQHEYYQLVAFFNALPHTMVGNRNENRDRFGNREPVITLDWPVSPAPGTTGKSVPTSCMVMKDAAFRPTFVLQRGEFNKPGARVQAGFPGALPGASLNKALPTRLDLARWLFEADNPLTARVAVNRLWEQYFGLGLAGNSDNLGKQGARPTHPELLDWLAAELRERQWDLQHVQRLILSSATYQQACRPIRVPGSERADFVGFPRQRLQAELIRDKVLAVAGLLDERLGGPPVFPVIPQADAALVMQVRDKMVYIASAQPDIYRRSVYLNVKRSVTYALFATFDMPRRDSCVIARTTTNTPLQALALLNEPFLIDSAKHMAAQTLREVGGPAQSQVAVVFHRALGRPPHANELALLLEQYELDRDYFRAHPDRTQQFLGTPTSAAATDSEQVAALALVCNLVFNLDEFLNKQ